MTYIWEGQVLSYTERQYAETVAWVTKIKDGKWNCQFVNHDGNRIFRSLKAAKAYALAIITLEN